METMEMTTATAAARKPPVPKGWRWVRVNDVARMGSGHTPDKKIPHYYNGGIKWVSLQDSFRLDTPSLYKTTIEISEAGLRNSSAVRHPANTVILLRDAGVGKSSIIREEMAVSQHFIAWRCSSDLLPEYLYYFLQHLKPYFEQQATGSTIKTLGLPFFEKLYLLLPSLTEQQQIVAVLKSLGDAATSTQKLLAAKRTYKRGLMQQLLTGQRRFPEFQGQQWREQRIASLISESRISGSNGKAAKKLTVKLYGKGVLAKNERQIGSENTKYYTRKAGQFIYSKLDFLNGAFGLIPAELDGYESTLDLPAFDISHNAHAHFLLAYFSRKEFYARFADIAEGGRKAVRIGPEELLKKKLLLPSLPEQQRIAAVLTACDQEIELLQAQLRQWEQQKKGLMQQLLTGQLRVLGI